MTYCDRAARGWNCSRSMDHQGPCAAHPQHDPYAPLFGSAIGLWHRSFQWTPVRAYDGRLIWFRSCWRRRIQKHVYLDGPTDHWWQYSVEDPRA